MNQNKNKNEKAREGTTSPNPLFSAATIFCMLGRTADIIKHANFQVNQFRDFGAPGAENDPHPLTCPIALTTVYALTCYTVILKINKKNTGANYAPAAQAKTSCDRTADASSVAVNILIVY